MRPPTITSAHGGVGQARAWARRSWVTFPLMAFTPAARDESLRDGVQAVLGQAENVGQGGRGEGFGGGARHGAGHVRHAVVDDALLDVDRVGVAGVAGGLHGAPQVDVHVDDDGAGAHRAHHLAGDDLGRDASRHQDAGDEQVRSCQFFRQGDGGYDAGGEAPAEVLLQVGQTPEVGGQDGDARARGP